MGELAKLIGYAMMALVGYGVYSDWKEQGGSVENLVSKADCSIVSVNQAPGTYFVNDNPDFGYTVRAVIRNTGERGIVKIKASLSTSEGRYERTQQLDFDGSEEMTLSYQFAEPTLNATNVQSFIQCSPSKRARS